MKIKRSAVLGIAVSIALYAQTQPALAEEEASGLQERDTEEVVVYGIRGSIKNSLTTKQESDAVIDVVSAEDVGKFPDKNLAEAIQRVPGVVINREYGEGERVSIRGTAPNLARTLYNGHALATADWFLLDQQNATRSFNFLMLPADIIGQVEVMKSSQANMEEGGVGGVVNVKTRNPLDLDPFRVYVNAQAVHTDLSGETDPHLSGLLSWKNANETFGALVGLVRQERNIRRDGVEVLGYFSHNAGPGIGNVLVPSLIGSALFEQERIRTGANFALQLRPSDRLEFNLTGLYSNFSADNINQNFMAWGSRALGNGGTLTNATIKNGTAVAGTIASRNNGTQDFGVVYDAIQRQAEAETRNIDLLTSLDINERWSGSLRIGYTDATGNTDNQPFVEFGAPARFDYDLRGSAPQVQYRNVDPTNPNNMQFIFSSLHELKNDDSEVYGYLDGNYALAGDWLESLDFGVKATAHKRQVTAMYTTYGGFHVPIQNTPASAFAGPQTPADFLNGIAATNTLRRYWQINRGRTRQLLFNNFNNISNPRILNPQDSFLVEEDTLGGYVMANIDSGRLRGNLGLRVVRTDQTSTGNVSSPQGRIQNAYGNYDPRTVNRSYMDILPSLNLAWEYDDNILYRFAASRVMTRPDFTDITPRASLNPGALTGSSGNPNLDPYRANQIEGAVEWYSDNQDALSFALFYKDIESFITDRPVDRILQISVSTPPNAACTPSGTTANLFNCPFAINERSNGGGGRVLGAELSGVWTLDNGFGLQANYTYANSRADSGDPLPGASRHQYNLTGFFENDTLSARLSYTYRSEFFVTFDRSTRLNQDSLESLDASAQYNINDNLALTFDAVNLTDTQIRQFAGNNSRPRAIYRNGPVYWFGVRISF